MKQTVTTREYDDEGRLVKETVIESEYHMGPTCTCASRSTYSLSYCPIHGWRQPDYNVYCGNIQVSTGQTYTINTSPISTEARTEIARDIARAFLS